MHEGYGASVWWQVANTAGDALMTELAKQEPEAKKGTLQSQYYMVRSISMGLVAALLSFGFNSPTYGGTFGWAFTVPQYLLILLGLVVVCLCVAPFPAHLGVIFQVVHPSIVLMWSNEFTSNASCSSNLSACQLSVRLHSH